VLSSAGIGDLNGDGLTDFVYKTDNALTVCLSKEVGVDCKSTTPTFPYSNWTVVGIGDYVGDGVPRMIVTVNNGLGSSGFISPSTWACRWADTQFVCQQVGNDLQNVSGVAISMDVDGSGVGSRVYLAAGSPQSDTVTGAVYSLAAAPLQDRITAVTNGIGLREEVDYTRGDDTATLRYTPVIGGVEQFPTYPLVAKSPGTVVKTLRRSNGQGGFVPTNYHYEGLFSDASGRGSAGFALRQSTDALGVVTTTVQAQSFPYTGMPQSVKVVSPGGVTLSDTSMVLNQQVVTLAGGGMTFFPFTKQTVTTKTDLDGSALGTVTVDSVFGDGWGNLTNQTATSVGGGQTFKSVVSTLYNNDATNWLLGRPTQVTTTATNPDNTSLTRTVAMDYDGTTGLQKSETVEPTNAALKVTTTFDRTGNAFGLVNKKVQTWTDPYSGATINRNVLDVDFDAKGRFPVKVRNPLGQATGQAFNAGTGAITSRTDPNSLTTSWTVNGFGRVLTELHPDGTEIRSYL
jgi:hypothetical protein